MSDKTKRGKGAQVLGHVMGGIDYMLPCVVAGGILMGLGYMTDDYAINPANYGYNTAVASFFTTSGNAVFSFMLPILAAFIGNHIAGSAAIAAGLAGGYLAGEGGSGFLGALLAGFVAGYTILLMEKALKKFPESLSGLKTLLLYPLLSVAVMGAVSIWILSPVVGAVNQAMNDGLRSMNGTSQILLGALVGGMEAADMGGPINKTAYLFATASLANGEYKVMSAVLAGGMVPPYATALATTFFKKKFTKEQRTAGITNYIIGLAGITEAAIPFAAADPMRVIPSCVVGSALAGGLSMALGCSVMAPFGGVFILPLNSNPLGFLFAVGIGSTVAMLLLGLSRKTINQETWENINGKRIDDKRLSSV